MLKYILEIEMILKSYISEIISNKYGIKDYLVRENFDEKLDEEKIYETGRPCRCTNVLLCGFSGRTGSKDRG